MEDVIGNIIGIKVSILNTDGFEQVEMLKPREVLDRREPKQVPLAFNREISGLFSQVNHLA
ncbi:MAG: hypothetical protein ABSD67_20085 [Terracidiphilus sp.]|jgi:hypothetical protein